MRLRRSGGLPAWRRMRIQAAVEACALRSPASATAASNDGEACNSSMRTAQVAMCQSGHGHCSGGKKNNKKCKHNKQCKGGGSCTGENAGAPGAIDPCDPYCTETTDTPTGLDAGPPFRLVDGGLTITRWWTPSRRGCSRRRPAADSTCGGAVNVHTNPCTGTPVHVVSAGLPLRHGIEHVQVERGRRLLRRDRRRRRPPVGAECDVQRHADHSALQSRLGPGPGEHGPRRQHHERGRGRLHRGPR